MNLEEAKERLSCYRPGIDDPADALFSLALEAVERDPQLAKWFQDQQEFDAAVRGQLRNAELPSELLEHLRSNQGKAVAGFSEDLEELTSDLATRETSQKIVPMSLWTRLSAVAAVIVIGLLAWNSLNSPARAVESFRGDMVKMAAEGFSLDHKSANLSEGREWLAKHGAPIYDWCRPCIGLKKGVGCRKFTWNDNTVSVLCFEKETGKVVHMFIVSRSALTDDVPEAELSLKQIEGLETGGWVDRKNVYLLVGANRDVEVGDLL